MKALFYTATAVFITLAGAIAFFALQPPLSVSGPRIVLDIDVSGMPAVETGGNSKTALDPYAGEEDKSPDAANDGQPASEQPGGEPREQASVVHEQPETAPASDAGPTPGTQAGQGEPVPPPPAGTALAGLNYDGPLFREVSPQGVPPADSPSDSHIARVFAPPSSGPTAEGPTPGAAAANQPQSEGPSLLSAVPPPGPPAGRDGLRGAADLAATDAAPAVSAAPPAAPDVVGTAPVETAEAPVVAPPPPPPAPPVPSRRPNNIPSAGERVAAADGNLGGVQFATTEATKPTSARIALLLRGVGRNQESADAIDSLPSAVSLGFWPYGSSSQQLSAQAREKGHEIIVQLPLEPTDYPTSNPGPDTLLTSLSAEQNAQRLEEVLKRFDGYSGVTNLMGGKMLQSKASLKPVLEDLKARGLVYVAESNRSHTTARLLAREVNLRYGAAEVIIDAPSSPAAIDKALTRLAQIARKRGSAIGIGTASRVTIQQVQAWSEKLAAEGITLVPVGALTQAPDLS